MSLLRDIARDFAWDLAKEAMPRLPAPIQEVVDDVREGNEHLRTIRHTVSAAGVRERQLQVAGTVRKIDRLSKLGQVAWDLHRRSRA